MSDSRELFRICACCPAPCRSAITARDVTESETPSGLSLIALAVMDGQLAADPEVLTALRRTAAARQCAAACPYRYNIAAAVEVLTARIGRHAESPSSDCAAG